MLKLRDVYGKDLVKEGVYLNALLSAHTDVVRCYYDGRVQERHELNGGRVLTYVNHYTATIKDNLTDEQYTLAFVARGVDKEFTYWHPVYLIRKGRHYQSPRFLNSYIALTSAIVSTIRSTLGEC